MTHETSGNMEQNQYNDFWEKSNNKSVEEDVSKQNKYTDLYIYEKFNAKTVLDDKNQIHLFRNGVELSNDLIAQNAKEMYMYDENQWAYRDKNDYVHLFSYCIELTLGIRTKGILQHNNDPKLWVYMNDKNQMVPLNFEINNHKR